LRGKSGVGNMEVVGDGLCVLDESARGGVCVEGVNGEARTLWGGER
jgi:hypothetical protein